MKTIQECQEAEETLREAEDNFLECLGFKKLSLDGQIDKWEPSNVVYGVTGSGSLTRSEAILNARRLLQVCGY
jgi:hypothetical protein